MRRDVIMFVGPTLADSRRGRALARSRGVRLRPPVRREDLTKLIAQRGGKARPGVLCIVDGVFHDALAVGHVEIREALALGWKVWGLSSMGAIRAREMESLGMRGFGAVFEQFRQGDDFQDDEVALLHDAKRPFRPRTEPLVHLRAAVLHLKAKGQVTDRVAKRVIAALKNRWFGERSIAAMLDLLKLEDMDPEAARRELGDFSRFRIKALDLELFLESAPWARGTGSLRQGPNTSKGRNLRR